MPDMSFLLSARTIAFSISLFLHGLLFMSFGGAMSAAVAPKQQAVTTLSFLAPQEVSQVEKKQSKEQKVEKKAEPIKKDKPTPIPKEVVKKIEPKQMPLEEVEQTQKIAASATPSAVSPQLTQGLLLKEKQRYLTEVMAHIEAYKWYPKAAKRRGIEGEVQVRFMLYADGTAGKIIVEDGPSMLMAAAREAVEKAVPMPTPPSDIHCPLACEFRMRFTLKAT